MRKLYRITFNTLTDADVIEVLESIPKTLRSQYVAETIRFAKAKLLECTVEENPEKQILKAKTITEETKEAPKEEDSKSKFNLSKLMGGF